MRLHQQTRASFVVAVSFAALYFPGLALGQPVCQPADQSSMQRHAFRFDDGTWTDVFERISYLTELPFISSCRPTGSFRNIPPSRGGRDKLYTVEEMIDLVNEILEPQNYVVLRRQASLTVLAADEAIDPTLVRAMGIEDLPKLGKSELAKITYPLEHVSADDIAPIAKKWAGRCGQVIPMKDVNRLVLVDSARNLCLMLTALRERADPSLCALWSHPCRHAKAAEVAAKLHRRFGAPSDPRKARATQLVIATNAASNTIFLSGPPATLSRARTMVANLEGAGRAPLTQSQFLERGH
jgi:hypothetical protein